jgi:glycosyltransferase involved in cell wall biosynthesis
VKILMAHNYYRQPGGEDNVFASEALLLEDHGHEVFRYSLRNTDAIDLGGARLAAKAIWNGETHREIRDLLRATRPEVVHFHNTFHLMSPSVYHAAKAEGVPVVQTVHNYRLLCANAMLLRDGQVCEDCLGRQVPWFSVQHRCYRSSHRASLAATLSIASHRILGMWGRCIDVMIAPSRFLREKLIEGGLPGDRIVVKPNFVHPDPGYSSGSGDYALFVGRLVPEKGIDTLLRAWDKLGSEIPLKIVGDGPAAAMVSDRAGRVPGIQWLGHRDRVEVLDIMRRARCVVVPSTWYENFPLVIVEAFATGVPVVASDLGALTELVNEPETGLRFAPGDPADLARQVRRLFDGLLDVSAMRVRVRREFEARYSAAANHELLLAIYQSAGRRDGSAGFVPTGRDR